MPPSATDVSLPHRCIFETKKKLVGASLCSIIFGCFFFSFFIFFLLIQIQQQYFFAIWGDFFFLNVLDGGDIGLGTSSRHRVGIATKKK